MAWNLRVVFFKQFALSENERVIIPYDSTARLKVLSFTFLRSLVISACSFCNVVFLPRLVSLVVFVFKKNLLTSLSCL